MTRMILALALAALFAHSSKADLVLIGDGVRNGFFGDTTNPTSASGDAITTNSSGRAFISSSATGDSISVDSWTAFRRGYMGGNAGFGWDASNLSGSPRTPGSVPYAFVNAGEVEFVADAVSGVFAPGLIFDLSFGSFTADSKTDHLVTAKLTFDSGEEFTGDLQVADNVGETAFFAERFVITQPATSVTLSLLLQSDTTDSDNNSRRDGQFTVDNVQLAAIPEVSGFLCVGLVASGTLLRIRRRHANTDE